MFSLRWSQLPQRLEQLPAVLSRHEALLEVTLRDADGLVPETLHGFEENVVLHKEQPVLVVDRGGLKGGQPLDLFEDRLRLVHAPIRAVALQHKHHFLVPEKIVVRVISQTALQQFVRTAVHAQRIREGGSTLAALVMRIEGELHLKDGGGHRIIFKLSLA